MDDERFTREVRRSVDKIREARESRSTFWEQAAGLGVSGWLFAIPVVGGAYLGRWLDRELSNGISWTITGIVLGIAVGIYNVWHFYSRRSGR